MRTSRILLSCAAVLAAAGAAGQEKIMFLNEGNWQADNGRLSYFENGRIVSNSFFRDANGTKLGDTPNCIIQLDDNRLAIALNWSNIIQFIDTDGKAIAATEDIPNNRYLVSDGKFVYVTSYAHEANVNGQYRDFSRGYVAKIDLATYTTVAAAEVGYEPEGIALYDGHLFVANSGGYAFQESHDYEKTVSIINPETMTVTRTVDTGVINLYGYLSRAGQYLCINSPGDYRNTEASTVIFDCRAALDGKPDADCFIKIDRPSTYNTATRDGKFLAVGASYSEITFESNFYTLTIDPALLFSSGGKEGVTERLPGTMRDNIRGMQSPYCIYVNPYTGYMYGTDADNNAVNGRLYQWNSDGHLLGTHSAYINPGHILALPPDGNFSGIENVAADRPAADAPVYNLQGIRVTDLIPGGLYIRNGRKFIFR